MNQKFFEPDIFEDTDEVMRNYRARREALEEQSEYWRQEYDSRGEP